MRLLRVLRLVLVDPRFTRHIAVAVARLYRVARRRHSLRRHVDAVGPHIGDVPGFIEPLRRPHGRLRAVAQFARRLLLKGRRHEGRGGISRGGFRLDRSDRQVGSLDSRRRVFRRRFVAKIVFIELVATEDREPRLERLAARRLQQRLD